MLTLQMLEAQDLLKGLNVECMEVFVSLFYIFFGLRHWKDGLAIGGRLGHALVWGRNLWSSLLDILGLSRLLVERVKTCSCL